MGLDIYIEWAGQTEEEHKAQVTGFSQAGEAGYLRSSYNEAGFNCWADRFLGLSGFYYIFGYDDEQERETGETDEDGEPQKGFYPDWDAAQKRAE